jgi:hypothetical protein
VTVSRETIRQWVNRFGRHFSSCIRRDRPGAADTWCLDEVAIPMSGRIILALAGGGCERRRARYPCPTTAEYQGSPPLSTLRRLIPSRQNRSFRPLGRLRPRNDCLTTDNQRVCRNHTPPWHRRAEFRRQRSVIQRHQCKQV